MTSPEYPMTRQTPQDSTAPSVTTSANQSTAKTIFGVGIGNLLEWFDWGMYAVMAPFFASHFFHSGSSVADLMSSFVVLGVAFVARPLGGLLFGWLADVRGRKLAMSIAVGMAAGGSLLIGICPGQETVGVVAPIMLVVARLAQGLAHGGEVTSAQSYLAEAAPRAHRGLWSSAVQFSGISGQIAGIALAAVLTSFLGADIMHSWGWRLPFVLGGLLGIYAFYVRSSMHETEVFVDAVANEVGEVTDDNHLEIKGGVWQGLRSHPKQLLQVVGVGGGMTLLMYVWTSATTAYAITVKDVPETTALWVSTAALAIMVVSLPFWGMLGDRVGRKPLLLVGVLVPGTLGLLAERMITPEAWSLFAIMAGVLLFTGGFGALLPAVYCELFPTKIRAAGPGLAHSIAVALFGGTAPYLQTYFGSIDRGQTFYVYVLVMCTISALTILTLPETKGIDLDVAPDRLPSETQVTV